MYDPPEKPKRLFVLAGVTFLSGAGYIFFPLVPHGFFRLVSILLGLGYLFVAWALLDCIHFAHRWAINLYSGTCLFLGLGAMGFLTPDPLDRISCLLSIFFNMCMVFAFGRNSVSRWYKPRVFGRVDMTENE